MRESRLLRRALLVSQSVAEAVYVPGLGGRSAAQVRAAQMTKHHHEWLMVRPTQECPV